jgi:hypothetical protein
LVFQRNDYITPKILETEAEIRDPYEEIGGGIKSKSEGEEVECTSGISEMDAIAETGDSRT